MKKKFAALLAIAAMMGIGSAFAETPFDTVDKESWDYRHVTDLADGGLIKGHEAEQLHSKRAYTRIEIAEMVYQALNNIQKADINQKADIIELAKRYKVELKGMAAAAGSKGLDLKKVIPVQYGSVRMRYMTGPAITNVKPGSIEGMVAKVGPDVGEKFDVDPGVNAYIAQNLPKAEMGITKLEALMNLSPEAFFKQTNGVIGFLAQSSNSNVANQAQSFLAEEKKYLDNKEAGLDTTADKAAMQGMINLLKTQIETAKANPTPQNLAKLKEIVKAMPIIQDFDRQKNESQFDTRLRLNVFGVLTPRTKALARIEVKHRWDKPDATKVHFDRLMMIERLGKVDVVIGRQGVEIGSGLTYNDYFDGVLVSYKKNDTRYTLAHGWPSKFKGQYAVSEVDPATMGSVLHANEGKLQASYAQITSKFGKAEGKVYYMKGNDGIPVGAVGAALDYNKNNWWIGGEYAKLLAAEKLPQPFGLLASLLDDDYAWTAGVGYGDFNEKKAGTWNVRARYLFEGRVAPIMNNYKFNQPFIGNYKAWNLEGNYAIKKDLSLNVGTFFNGKSVKNTEKYDNVFFASLNYNF